MESLVIERRWESFVKKQDLLSIENDESNFWKSPMSNQARSQGGCGRCGRTALSNKRSTFLIKGPLF